MPVIEMSECPMCRGTGTRVDGSTSDQCSGTGRIPVLDTPDGEDLED